MQWRAPALDQVERPSEQVLALPRDFHSLIRVAAIGAGFGGIAGYLYCASDDARSEPKADPKCNSDRKKEECYKRYYEETAWCGEVYTDDFIYESCMNNAWANLIRCLNGLPPKPFPPAK